MPGAQPVEEALGMQMSRLSCDVTTGGPVAALAVEMEQTSARTRIDTAPRAFSSETPQDGPRIRPEATLKQMVTTSHDAMT